MVLLWGVIACRSARPHAGGGKKSQQVSSDELLNKYKTGEFQFRTLALKGDGEFQNKKEKLTFTYRVSMVQDSVIWCSVSKLGMEAFRIQITADTLQVLDRLNKKYAETDYRFIRGLTGMDLDFQALQSVLTGNIAFVKDSLQADSRSKLPNRFIGRRDSTYYAWELSDENFKVNRVDAENNFRNQKSYIAYSSFQDQGGYLLPAYILLTVIRPERNQLELTHTRVDLNPENLSLSFSIPDNYERIRLQ